MTGDAYLDAGGFLASSEARVLDWSKPPGAPVSIETVEVLFGNGDRPLEAAIAASSAAPRADDVRRLWKTRANRGAPVLLVVLHPAGGETLASVIGTEGDPAPLQGLSRGRVERIAAAALDEPNRHQAIRTLDRLLGSVSREGLTAGVINAGLFAAHELKDGVPRRGDWEDARTRSLPLLGRTGRELLDALGYQIEPKGPNLLALADAGSQHAVAVVLDEAESFDRTSSRFGGVSPVSRALAQAQQERLPWVIALRRNQIRLYPADPDVGVGRKGLTETYIELDLTLLDDTDAGYLALLFSPEALAKGGSVEEILHNSAVYATDLGARLRARIYEDVVPDLAVAVATRMGASTEADLDSAYHRTLIILFRLLFVAYAEDRGLLPFERNPRYTRNALKTYARDFAEDPGQVFSPESTSIWEDLVQVWNAIDSGEPRWDVPAYNGGLFATDETHPDGAAVSALGLTNTEIGPALMAMLVDADAQGDRGPVDFRSLSVREFGTIYEGLLESSLSIAPSDLTLDREQTYVPAKEGDLVVVQSGGVYFHNASGQRKSTGSYFTKSFAVEHLLDTALEPAITEHLERVKALINQDNTRRKAAEEFFDFRVADLAMGSGHFLVAAIDRIEARFSAFLSENPLPAVADELARLEAVAREALGEEQGLLAEIEPSLLLRRQIARRCIYGLDINLIAVELARLAIWIHTFVPGLPMSSLDHGLVHANSLTGMGTIEEALSALDPQAQPGQFSLFSASIEDALTKSKETLVKVALASEATKQEVRQAAEEHRRALAEAEDARLLMDAAVAVRLGLLPVPMGPDHAIEALKADNERGRHARTTLAGLMPAHFPYLFPEVFLRDRPGFSVILGNPPWEKVKVEEHIWWGAYAPGLRGLPQREKNALVDQMKADRPDLVAAYEREVAEVDALRSALLKMCGGRIGSGDTDLYKIFAWRDWDLVRPGGCFGVVFPRSVLNGSGTSKWREEVMAKGSFASVTTLTNTGQWVFDGVDGRYSIALLAVEKAAGDEDQRVVTLVGPFHSHEGYLSGRDDTLSIAAEEFATWASGAAFPLLPSARSAVVFSKMRKLPRFDAGGDFEFRPVAELHATQDKQFFGFDLNEPRGDLKVLAGASFNIWEPDFGPPYAYARRDEVLAHLQQKRQRQARTASSAFQGMDVSSLATLPCLSPRIAFRDVTNQTNQRTTIACLLPAGLVFVHNAPYLLRRRGTCVDEAYLLGVMSSVPFDWYSRRFVETHVTFDLLSAFPVPRPVADDPLRRRVVEIAARLACVDERYADWLLSVEAEIDSSIGAPARLDEGSSLALIAELDALVALLYGLSADDVRIVFETFHRGWDFGTRLDAVLANYAQWEERARELGHLKEEDA